MNQMNETNMITNNTLADKIQKFISGLNIIAMCEQVYEWFQEKKKKHEKTNAEYTWLHSVKKKYRLQ